MFGTYLCHKDYFLAHSIHLMTKSDPICFLISHPVLLGRTIRWELIIGEYKIVAIITRAIKSQSLADILSLFLSDNHEPIDDALPGRHPEGAMCEEAGPWFFILMDSLLSQKEVLE